MGTAGSQSLNPDSAVYKLNRLWVNFVTSLKLSLPIYEMVMTNLYLTRLKWELNNTLYLNCQWPKEEGWVRVSLNRFRQEREWSRKIILFPQLLYRQKDSKCCFKGCVMSTRARTHTHTFERQPEARRKWRMVRYKIDLSIYFVNKHRLWADLCICVNSFFILVSLHSPSPHQLGEPLHLFPTAATQLTVQPTVITAI